MKFKYLSIIIILFSFMSCDKDAEENKIDNKPLSAIEQKIIKFKTDLTSCQKDELVYGITEAEWYLEGLLNYEEANNEHNYHNLQFVKDVYNVPVINGTISNSELLAAYTQFFGEITEIVEDETLFSDLVDITIVEPETKDGTMDIEMTYSYGSGVAIYNYTQFAVGEDWMWGWDMGACGDNPSSDTTDASNRLQEKFNNPVVVGVSGFFTDVFFKETMAFDWDSDTTNPAYPVRQCIIYLGGNQNQCIEHEELNFYLNKFDYIKDELNTSNDDFKSVEITDDVITGKDGSYFHYYRLFYGTFNLGSGVTL